MESILFALLMVNACTAAGVLWLCGRVQARQPQNPQPAPAPESMQEEAQDQRLPLDQGFENLMRYQVQLGHGRSTGGGIS